MLSPDISTLPLAGLASCSQVIAALRIQTQGLLKHHQCKPIHKLRKHMYRHYSVVSLSVLQ